MPNREDGASSRGKGPFEIFKEKNGTGFFRTPNKAASRIKINLSKIYTLPSCFFNAILNLDNLDINGGGHGMETG